MSSLTQRHRRYQVQAGWTAEIRSLLYSAAGVDGASYILEVGCGTGVITTELRNRTRGKVIGVDIDPAAARFAHSRSSMADYAAAEAHHLAFPAGQFDLTLCHFLLLWVQQPGKALEEMIRVTKRGGAIASLAEPDYGGRLDHPPELAEIGELQIASLLRRGADPLIGRKLKGLFHEAGLTQVWVGVLGGEWKDKMSREEFESEWETMTGDLAGLIPAEKIASLRRLAEDSRQRGHYLIFVPTFYAIGRVP